MRGTTVEPQHAPSDVAVDSHATSVVPPRLRHLSIPLMLAGGALIACQSTVNSHLARDLGDGLRSSALAAVINFGSGLVVLTILLMLAPPGRRGVSRLRNGLQTRSLRPIELVGGLCGAFFVACQSITVGTIGVAMFIVAFTAGQATASLVLDRCGLVSHKQPVSPSRVLAVCLAVVAVLLSAAERLTNHVDLLMLFFLALALLAGSLSALQQALNGRVAAVAGPLAATWSNFVVGTVALTGFLAVALGMPGQLSGLPSTWWHYLGGLIGVVFIGIATVTVRTHGVLVLALCTIAGQVATAQLIDALGPDPRVGAMSVSGGVLTVVGVLIALARRPRDLIRPLPEPAA